MSNQLSIQTTSATYGTGGPAPGATSPAASAQAAPAAKPVPLFANPSSQFDATVGMVVLNFHNSSGTVTSSIPNERQLEAYRTGQESPPGEPAPKIP